MSRSAGRKSDEIRKTSFHPYFLKHPEGSCLIECGDTRVLATITVEEKVPPFLKGQGTGWLAAEYDMLPGSTEKRHTRERTLGKVSGRSQEIQRLLGRSLRGMIDLKKLGEKTLLVDCDVLQADGGTRVSAINAGAVALTLAIKRLHFRCHLNADPLLGLVSAVSIGIVRGEKLLDLDFQEDSNADVDLNIVENEKGELLEVQGTGENRAFALRELFDLIQMGEKGLAEIIKLQKDAIEAGYETILRQS